MPWSRRAGGPGDLPHQQRGETDTRERRTQSASSQKLRLNRALSLQSIFQFAHIVQHGAERVWEATVPGVELRPRLSLAVYDAKLVMGGLTLNVRGQARSAKYVLISDPIASLQFDAGSGANV
jgi:hypothetical protein